MRTTYRVRFSLFTDPGVYRDVDVTLDAQDAHDAWDRRITLEDMVVLTVTDAVDAGDPDNVNLVSWSRIDGPELVAGPRTPAATIPPIHGVYVAMVRAIGPGFHPDTRGDEYTSLPDGFTPAMVDGIVDATFAANVDPYIVALDVLNGGDGTGQ